MDPGQGLGRRLGGSFEGMVGHGSGAQAADGRRTATGTAHLGCATHTPSMRAKVSTSLGKAWEMISATSALAVRWSSGSLLSQPSLQFLVFLNSHRITPAACPSALLTCWMTSPPN